MSNTLKQIVKNIQFVKGWSIEQVAQSIGYSRVHLNKAMNSADGNGEMEELLKVKHEDILQNVSLGKETKGGGSLSSEDMANKLIRIEAQQSVILGTQAEILAHLTDRSVPALLRQKANEVKTMEEELRGEHGTR